MQAVDSVISLSPSFSSYSNTTLADIAARVVDEFVSDEFYFDREDENSDYAERERGNHEEDDEFEFAFVTRDSDFSSADEIFHNGQIRPNYPVFNRDVFLAGVVFHNGNENQNDVVAEKRPAIRLPLRKLFSEERETAMTMTTTSSSSSSEVDELDGVPAETYCVWRPKEEEDRCKKSSSTGSNSKRWKFKHLLNRSHSDGGKGNFVFLSFSNSGRKKEKDEKVNALPMGGGGVRSAVASPPPPPRRCNLDGGDKRMSYLPYDQDLGGLFSNVNNGLSKNLQSF